MKTNTWGFRLAAVAASVAVMSGGALAANAATTTSSPTSTTCHLGERALAVYATLPAALQADLKTLKATTPGPARRAEAREIRTKALDGGYGAQIEYRAKHLKARGIETIASLPPAFTAEIKAIRQADTRDEKIVLIKQLAADSIDGDFGAQIEKVAKKVVASTAYQTCIAS